MMEGATKKKSHKYVTISKVGAEHFVKYRTSDLIQFYQFITAQFKEYRFTNVYSNVGANKGTQLGSFTKATPPPTKDI